MTRPEFLEAAYLICEKCHCSVTSGYRTRQRNAAVGGKPNSRHLTGFGMDLVLDERTPETIQALKDEAFHLGLSALDEGDHFHLQSLGPEGRVA